MPTTKEYDAVIVGSGPNGLTAANLLASHGLHTLVIEGSDTVGGGVRSGEATLPGFIHDHCSAVHPTGYLSPAFRSMNLEQFGLEWILPHASAAHPLDGRPAAMLYQGVEQTVERLGRDAQRYRRLTKLLLPGFDELLGQLLDPFSLPRRPFAQAKFGLPALLPAKQFSNLLFSDQSARALFAGCAAHSILPLDFFGTAAVGLVFLLSGHIAPWPIAKGGSQRISDALLSRYKHHGGELHAGRWVNDFGELPPSKRYLFDLAPRQLSKICRTQLSQNYIKRIEKFQYGPAVFKIDYALSQPIPWTDPSCLDASTVHVGGTSAEIASSERDAWEGRISNKPFVMVCQQSQFDSSRAPGSQHTGYAYCHVPNGCNTSMVEQIENQIERFAPGFRDCILARHTTSPAEMEAHNPSCIGGTITGGAATLAQLFTRPIASFNPYQTSNPKIYLCSHATPPGGGVHGMCGYSAAKRVLKSLGR